MAWTIEGFGLEGPCLIQGGESLAALLADFPAPAVMVVEKRVALLHGDKLPGDIPRLLLPSLGEGLKEWGWVRVLLSFFHSRNLSRSHWVLAVGGGALTDLVSFAASLYKRGVRTALVPTTLLAQVDAALGGKCGINWRGIKNLLGNFYFPHRVICAADVLTTLPRRQYWSGMGEVYKYQLLQGNFSQFQVLRRGEILRAVAACCRYKDSLVAQDPFDRGGRRVLNFGHTLAHALEGLAPHFLHGEAVAWGLDFALRVAAGRGSMSQGELRRILVVLAAMPRPRLPRLDFDLVWAKMTRDKKNAGRRVQMVLPGPGGEFGLYQCSRGELEEIWRQLNT
ncbi:MAG: 3-dehydroquinate synthase [Bacillota bacterium]|jgi:3-dehydroquinate synthetase